MNAEKNRLIIIGNGFDMAHGLKSSSVDFIKSYLQDCFIKFVTSKYYEDELLKIEYITNHNIRPANYDKDEDIIDIINNNVNESIVKLLFHCSVLGAIFNRIRNGINWVDMEYEYHTQLLNFSKLNPQDLEKFNETFSKLKSKLLDYLKLKEQDVDQSVIENELVECFTEKYLGTSVGDLGFKNVDRICFLNFNYTSIASWYLERCQSHNPTLIHIHGSLDGKYGEPIFGYGDEHDSEYKELERRNNNELFRHMKSFEYLKNSNYQLLLSFLEKGDFDVHIYGHSCGISDRTLLTQIFEHANCNYIKIFYYQNGDTDDFTQKTYEISRHIRDKMLFRKLVVPKDQCRPMPQPVLV